MELLIPVILSIVILILLFRVYLAYQLRNLDKLIEQKVRDSIPTMFTEIDGNTVYLYDKKTNNFQCQAATIEELAERLLEVRKIELAKVTHNNKEIWFVTGDVLDEIEFEINPKE
jgi:hypothetical protein